MHEALYDYELCNRGSVPSYIFITHTKHNTVKFVLSGHSKKDKTKVLMAIGSLMKVKSIAECSFGAYCNTFDLHYAIISLEK